MKTHITSLFLILCLSTYAQSISNLTAYSNPNLEPNKTVEKTSFKDKLYTGGNIGISGNFSDYMAIRVSPLLGARLSEKLYSGLGVEYIYTMDKRYYRDINAHDYGFRLFSQYDIIKQLFAHAEFAAYNYDSYYLNDGSNRVMVPYILLGGGYRQKISQKSFFSFRILFDVLQNENSPYKAGEPQISLGFGIGL